MLIIPSDKLISEDTFSNYFQKQYKKIVILDNKKYHPPKYSYALKQLAKHFDIYQPDAVEPSPNIKNSFNSVEKLNSPKLGFDVVISRMSQKSIK